MYSIASVYYKHETRLHCNCSSLLLQDKLEEYLSVCLSFALEAVAMRRQKKSLVSDSKENVPSIHSSSEEGDRMADVSDTVIIDSDEFMDIDAFGDNLEGNVVLDTKLDTIFADVASKLPSIDFDMSDVSYVEFMQVIMRKFVFIPMS